MYICIYKQSYNFALPWGPPPPSPTHPVCFAGWLPPRIGRGLWGLATQYTLCTCAKFQVPTVSRCTNGAAATRGWIVQGWQVPVPNGTDKKGFGSGSLNSTLRVPTARRPTVNPRIQTGIGPNPRPGSGPESANNPRSLKEHDSQDPPPGPPGEGGQDKNEESLEARPMS